VGGEGEGEDGGEPARGHQHASRRKSSVMRAQLLVGGSLGGSSSSRSRPKHATPIFRPNDFLWKGKHLLRGIFSLLLESSSSSA